jgi:hypothetical protein
MRSSCNSNRATAEVTESSTSTQPRLQPCSFNLPHNKVCHFIHTPWAACLPSARPQLLIQHINRRSRAPPKPRKQQQCGAPPLQLLADPLALPTMVRSGNTITFSSSCGHKSLDAACQSPSLATSSGNTTIFRSSCGHKSLDPASHQV